MNCSIEDYEFLGSTNLRAKFSHSIILIWAAGVQTFLSCYGFSRFLESPKDVRRGRVFCIALSFLIFGIFTLAAAVKVHQNFETTLHVSNGLEYILTIEADNVWFDYVTMTCYGALLTIGDGLLLYRCYIILNDTSKWWLVVPPAFTFLGTIASVIIQFTSQNSDIELSAVIASVCLGAVTNIFITTIITYHLIKSQKSFTAILPGKTFRVYNRVTSILIESAVPLAVSGLLYAALSLAILRPMGIVGCPHWSVRLGVTSSTVGTIHYVFLALSPQMILFRVTTGRSWTKHPSTAEDLTRPNFTHSLAFASGLRDQESRDSDMDARGDVRLQEPSEDPLPSASSSRGSQHGEKC
ncbi:hypothetical protein FA15DRAFT_705451 [Coprinopsis marcescibilis]|uniref:Uncharacterized protein n=1 Tax=Coprinopsis marcescibilis TaxID=230819 RepID=A0A5C3KSH3_COPMA|nr:hypothetical protein FA15DRAFT_705451 [Coprinopsis marcescibilis]